MENKKGVEIKRQKQRKRQGKRAVKRSQWKT